MNKEKLAIAGLICGIVGIVFTFLSFFYIFALITPFLCIAAIVLGAIGLKKLDGTTNAVGIVALIMGIVFLLISMPLCLICGVGGCAICNASEADINNFANQLANELNSYNY